MSRQALTATTLVVLLVLLGAGALWGWRSLSAPVGGEDADRGPRCARGVERGDTLTTREVTVSVFNAGNRSGLAGRTLDELASRKFIGGEVGNAPSPFGDSVREVRVLAPKRNDPAAELVALQFGKDTFIQATDRNLGPGVDVVVGDRFVGLVEAPRRIKAAASGSGC